MGDCIATFGMDVLKILIPASLSILVAVVGWRWQTLGKRKLELAEQVLLQFNLAADMLQNARLPWTRKGEGESREKHDFETPSVASLKNQYWIAVERINDSIGLLAECRKNELLARYFFGAEAEKAIHEIKTCADKIVFSARMLMSNADLTILEQTNPAGAQEILKKQREWQSIIWGSFDKDDKIHTAINEARSKLEAILMPQFRKGSRLWPW